MATKIPNRFKGKVRDAYLALVMAFPLASVRSEDHLKEAQKVIDQLLAKGTLKAKPNSRQAKQMFVSTRRSTLSLRRLTSA